MPTVQSYATRNVEDAQIVIVQDARVGDWSVSGAFEVFDADDSVTASRIHSGGLTVRVMCAMPDIDAEQGFDLEVDACRVNVVIGYSGEVIAKIVLA